MVSGLAFTLMALPIRLAGDLPTLEKVFFRNLFGFIFICLLLLFYYLKKQPISLHSQSYPLQICRALLGVVAMSLTFYALEHTQIATVTGIGFLRPVLVTLLMFLFFQEVIRLRRLGAMVIGFLGVLVISQFAMHLDKGMVAALIATVFMSLVTLAVRRLAQIDPPQTTVFWMGLIMSPVSLMTLLMLSDWVTPVGMQWFWVALIGLLSSIAQVSLVTAMKYTPLSLLLPFDFLKIIWSVLIGLLFFAESIQLHVVIGSSMILAATIYISVREGIVRRTKPPIGE